MFLCLVARPRWSADGDCTFDGKLGIWAFAEESPAICNSKNCPRGTMELKNVSVTKEVFRSYVRNFVLPSIQDRWPCCCVGRNLRRETVMVQFDNCRVHMKPAEFDQIADEFEMNGLEIHSFFQPSNSPDTNVLDLGVFNTI